MYKSILVPLDGSEHARIALTIAHQLASPGGRRLHLLHVSDIRLTRDVPAGAGVGASLTSAMTFTREEIEKMNAALGEKVERAEQSGRNLVEQVKEAAGLRDLDADVLVRIGRPADVIVEEAEALGVEAIVIGSRGISDIASLLLGSVSHRVLHTAPCRVILVH